LLVDNTTGISKENTQKLANINIVLVTEKIHENRMFSKTDPDYHFIVDAQDLSRTAGGYELDEKLCRAYIETDNRPQLMISSTLNAKQVKMYEKIIAEIIIK